MDQVQETSGPECYTPSLEPCSVDKSTYGQILKGKDKGKGKVFPSTGLGGP
jgi:hypothetical protein